MNPEELKQLLAEISYGNLSYQEKMQKATIGLLLDISVGQRELIQAIYDLPGKINPSATKGSEENNDE